jgi:galactokinase/mevalonate kinase-like predicted kinase
MELYEAFQRCKGGAVSASYRNKIFYLYSHENPEKKMNIRVKLEIVDFTDKVIDENGVETRVSKMYKKFNKEDIDVRFRITDTVNV